MKTLIAAALLAATTTASAQFVSGNSLHKDLSGSLGDRMFAMGFIAGISDAYDEDVFCLPPRTQLGQIRDVVTKFLIDNPKERHNPAGVLVLVSLMESFPCKKGGGV